MLRDENQEVAEIYMLVRRQYVTRHNGKFDYIVDVSIPAIESAMRAKGVKDQWSCLTRVRKLFHHFLEDQNES
ncbi:MAG: hypothetical protein CVU71_03635 [Deltaproteobacteria bacterium HGW-Deltaproteobacteria-6]|nr:MAG: hypothetical protein CVU71_03635 [Deltaproteobacteria bacterium HGW-Deltaproteobacteria-6]